MLHQTVKLSMIPKDLQEYSNWVNWRLEKRDGKQAKIPVDPKSGQNARSDNPETWGTFSEAVKYLTANKKKVAGIGFEFTGSPFSGIDLDRCLDPQTGVIEPWAGEIVEEMNSYTEVSPGGTGLHILIKGKPPAGRRRRGHIEIYGEARYFAITGQHLEGTPLSIKARWKKLKRLHSKIFGVEIHKPASTYQSKKPVKNHYMSDSELIQKAMQAKNGHEFSRLWSGDWSRHKSQSEGDFHLCCMLAFWTGKNSERMDRLFQQSRLLREKWKERRGKKTYGQITIQKAIAKTREVYIPSL
jgi:primase-polymerase (primpol)-like protein